MNNKTFISFCINLLIGILFSFPVFSAQNSVQSTTSTDCEYTIFDNYAGLTNISDSEDGPAKLFPFVELNQSSQSKFSQRHFFHGNKNNSSHNYFHFSYTGKLLSTITAPEQIYFSSIFVNISYLKDLRTTKMLC